MQYSKLSALAQDTALRLEEVENAPAVAFFAAGAEHEFFSYGGRVSIACFCVGDGTLALDGQNVLSAGASAVYSAALSAGVHSIKLTCANGIEAVLGGREV